MYMYVSAVTVVVGTVCVCVCVTKRTVTMQNYICYKLPVLNRIHK
jgi:hypothetical protein